MTKYPLTLRANDKWVRSENGVLFGVCQGISERYQFHANTMRIFWFLSVALLGSGLLLYVILGLTLPREDQMAEYQQEKFLGVCYRLSLRTGMELGVVRMLFVFAGLFSFGLVFLGYLVLALLMPRWNEKTIW